MGIEIVYDWAADWVALIRCKILTRVTAIIPRIPFAWPRLRCNVINVIL